MTEELSEKNRFNQDGTVQISQGTVKVYDPSGTGSPAVIYPDPGAIIHVNAEVIRSPRILKSSDHVEIEPLEETLSGSVEVRVAKNGMKAEVLICPGITVSRKLKDQFSQREVMLAFAEERRKFLDVTVEDVYRALAEQGVNFGVDIRAIEQAVKTIVEDWVVVARGKEMVPGVNGYVELHVSTGLQKIAHDEDLLTQVNYKEKIQIPFVEQGDRLATIHPPQPGKPGSLVTGKVLEPPPVKSVQVVCKEGCVLSRDGGSIYANKPGKPVVEGGKNDVFSITPVFVHNGDVDMKSGNIRFNGDIKTTGDVLEGMLIEAAGDIEIMGNTAGARLVSGKNIISHNNLINTRVEAGLLKTLYRALSPLLKEVEESLSTLFYGVEQLQLALTSKGKKVDDQETGRLAQIIVERKLENLPQIIAQIATRVHDQTIALPQSFLKSINTFKDLFQETGLLNIRSKADLLERIEETKEARHFVERMLEIPGSVEAGYVQNCTVVSGGNITVNGVGTYNSFFYAGGDVHIEKVARGGEITAEGNLYIGEAGSPGMAIKPKKIQLSTRSIARFRKVYENVIIVFGTKIHKFEAEHTHVKVYYSTNEDLVRIVNL